MEHHIPRFVHLHCARFGSDMNDPAVAFVTNVLASQLCDLTDPCSGECTEPRDPALGSSRGRAFLCRLVMKRSGENRPRFSVRKALRAYTSRPTELDCRAFSRISWELLVHYGPGEH